MLETTEKKSSFNKTRSHDSAHEYNQKRFSSRKMKVLDQAEKDFARLLVNKVGPTGTLLDAPCGSGRFTPLLKDAGQVTGYDICENMLEVAKKNNPFDNAFFELGDATQLTNEDASVDGVFCMRLLHHIESADDRQKILSELARVTKKWVALSFYRKSFIYYKRKFLGKKVNGFPVALDQVLSEAKACGLKPYKIIKFPFLKTNQTLVLFEKIGS